MTKKLILLLALCALASCQRAPEPKPTDAITAEALSLNEAQKLELAAMRAVFGGAVRMVAGQAQATADLPELGQPGERAPMKVAPLGVRLLADGQAALVTAAIPRDSAALPGEREETLTAVISAYLLEPAGGAWKVARRHESVAGVGSRGEAGELTWLSLGPGRPGFAIVDQSGNRGQTIQTLTLFDLGAKDIGALPAKAVLLHSDNDGDCEDERPRCWSVSGQWRMVQAEGHPFAELQIDFQGVLEQRAEDLAQGGVATDGADALPPRERRQVKASARYAVGEEGLRLLSGENLAERIDG